MGSMPLCTPVMKRRWRMPRFDRYSQQRGLWARALLPLGLSYQAIMQLRRWAYQYGLFASHRFPVPVIIVGNITVGGTGKTPLVLALAEYLRTCGFNPGIVSRGYKGTDNRRVQQVMPESQPQAVGDEPYLLAMRSDCPVVIGRDRVAAVRYLLKHTACDCVIADDGLQHLALGRTVEIGVCDGLKRFGNGYALPAGPLRESVARWGSLDVRIVNGTDTGQDEYRMQLEPVAFYQVGGAVAHALSYFQGKTVHAVTGIGHPERFFATLRDLGITVIPHAFADHHPFQATDVTFADAYPVLMTEKDAVKCRGFGCNNLWALQVKADLPEACYQEILSKM